MFAIKYVIMFEHANVQMFKYTFEQNNVITNVRNIVRGFFLPVFSCFVLLEAREFLAKHA